MLQILSVFFCLVYYHFRKPLGQSTMHTYMRASRDWIFRPLILAVRGVIGNGQWLSSE